MRYSKISFAEPRPVTEFLSPDGRPHGQHRAHGFRGGEGFQFRTAKGDKLDYRIHLEKPIENAVLVLRAKTEKQGATLAFNGSFSGRVALDGDGFQLLRVESGKTLFGEVAFSVEKLSDGAAQLDGFALLPENETEPLRFEDAPWEPVPEKIARPASNSMLLKYRDVAPHYGVVWETKGRNCVFREHFTDDLDCNARKCLNDLLSTKIQGPGDGHFANAMISPIFVEGHASFELCGLVCQGSEEEVERRLKSFDPEAPALRKKMDALASTAFKSECSKAGAKYLESQDFMAALTLSQVVYPVNTAGAMIRHSPPGRWWDCLYTWDSGFIGLGLSTLDAERAIWNLNAYMNQGESYAAFIHHGTPMPAQHYLYQELWNRTQSIALLERFYKPLEKYYLFLAGRTAGSTTRNMKSKLIRVWDYNYNSGGWDDYPPQVATHALKLDASATPAVTTAHLARCAKLLRMAALKLGLPTEIYDEDIAIWSDALNRYSWDSEAGYYSYVLHDAAGEPCGILRHESGANYDMGMDGASPLVAGICDPAQEKALVANLMTKGRMWTGAGISTVDLRAPYYSDSGYWNGSVWLPHQWFFWKAMLDLGRAKEAFKIARTALELWRRETKLSGGASEHFTVKGGRGAGWHHFSGLSCPVLNWFAAYFRPGTFTAGFDAFIEKAEFKNGNKSLAAELSIHSSREGHCSCLAVMAPDAGPWRVLLDGRPAAFNERLPGVVELDIPLSAQLVKAKIDIERKTN